MRCCTCYPPVARNLHTKFEQKWHCVVFCHNKYCSFEPFMCFVIISTVHLNLLCMFVIINTVHLNLLCMFVIINTVHLNLLCMFVIINTVHLNLLCMFVIINTVHLNLLCMFVIINTVHLNLLCMFRSCFKVLAVILVSDIFSLSQLSGFSGLRAWS